MCPDQAEVTSDCACASPHSPPGIELSLLHYSESHKIDVFDSDINIRLITGKHPLPTRPNMDILISTFDDDTFER